MYVFSNERTHLLLFLIYLFVTILFNNYNDSLIIIKNNESILDEIIFEKLLLLQNKSSNSKINKNLTNNNKFKSASLNRDLNFKSTLDETNMVASTSLAADEPSFVITTTPSILFISSQHIIPTNSSSVSFISTNSYNNNSNSNHDSTTTIKIKRNNNSHFVNLFVNILKSILQIGM